MICRLMVLGLVLMVGGMASAEDKKQGKGAKPSSRATKVRPLRLSLRDVALLTFRNNSAIRRSRLDPVIAEGDLRKAKAEFDPVLFGSAKLSHEESESGSTGGSSLFSFFGSGSETDSKTTTKTRLFELGLRKKVRTGGTLELVYSSQGTDADSAEGEDSLFSSFFSVMNPSWTNRFELRLNQPLLQGFGVEFNMAAIRIAELSRKIAQLSVEDAIREAVSEALNAYWDLALSIRSKEIQLASLERSQALLKINEERLKRGLVSQLDVLRARVGVAQRKERVIQVNQQILDVEDQLKKLILPQDEVFYTRVTLLPTEALDYKAARLHLPDLVKTAMVGRPDYARAKKQFESLYLAYRRSRNLLLPRLDFQGKAGYQGVGSNFGSANNQVFDFDLFSWEVGLVVEVPLGNRKAKGDFQKAKAELQKAQIDLEHIEKQIVLEVRQSTRGVASTLQRIETAKESRDLTKKQLDAELARFKQGRSTNKIVLDYEQDLARQQLSYLEAVISHKKAMVNLSRSQGIIIQTHLGTQRDARKYSPAKIKK